MPHSHPEREHNLNKQTHPRNGHNIAATGHNRILQQQVKQ